MRVRPTPRNTPVLVWGATGFIGSALVEALLAAGGAVRVLTRGDARAHSWSETVEWVTYDPSAPAASFDAALAGVSTVYSLAGSSGAVASNRAPLESLDSNCRLHLALLDACERAATHPHVVFSSSRLVYGPCGRQPVTELHPTVPLSMYAAHKVCVEHYHRIYADRGAITFSICRISNPYGIDVAAPGKGYGFVNSVIQRALAGQRVTLFGDGRQLRDYVYIEDAVRALRLCGTSGEARNEVFNVGAGHSVAMHRAVTEIQRRFGGGGIDLRPWPAEYRSVESGDFVMDVGKACRVLGWTPAFTFETGLDEVRRRTVDAGARHRTDGLRRVASGS